MGAEVAQLMLMLKSRCGCWLQYSRAVSLNHGTPTDLMASPGSFGHKGRTASFSSITEGP